MQGGSEMCNFIKLATTKFIPKIGTRGNYSARKDMIEGNPLKISRLCVLGWPYGFLGAPADSTLTLPSNDIAWY